MPMQYASPIVRVGAGFAFVLVLAACTPGGNFDPTEWVNLDTKKKIPGDREPLFPNGVPGAETGVPPDLVKGYQPPPEAPAVADAPPPAAVAAAVGAVEPKPKPKAKPKPKPKVASAPPAARQHDPAWDAKPAPPAQTNWPAPNQQAAPHAQTNWPAPPAQQQAAPQAQTNWPSPPPPGTYSR
jgi:hypothetical protein